MINCKLLSTYSGKEKFSYISEPSLLGEILEYNCYIQ